MIETTKKGVKGLMIHHLFSAIILKKKRRGRDALTRRGMMSE